MALAVVDRPALAPSLFTGATPQPSPLPSPLPSPRLSSASSSSSSSSSSLSLTTHNSAQLRRQLVRQRINETFESPARGAPPVELSGLSLDVFPEELSELLYFRTCAPDGTITSDVELFLNSNVLRTLSPTLFKLVNLTVLSLRNNEIRCVPGDIRRLVNLRELNLANNALSVLPAEIARLPRLSNLVCHPNPKFIIAPIRANEKRAISLTELALRKVYALEQGTVAASSSSSTLSASSTSSSSTSYSYVLCSSGPCSSGSCSSGPYSYAPALPSSPVPTPPCSPALSRASLVRMETPWQVRCYECDARLFSDYYSEVALVSLFGKEPAPLLFTLCSRSCLLATRTALDGSRQTAARPSLHQ